MKKLPFVIVIPFLAIAIAIGVAMAMRMTSKAKEPVPEFVMPTAVRRAEIVGSPSSSFGVSLGSTGTNSGDLTSELQTTVDDEGASDLNTLDQEFAGL
jgi:hypothetical protein